MMRAAGYIAALMVVAGLAGCATGVQPDDPYAIKLDQLSQRVDRLDRVLTHQNLADMSQRLDDIEAQVRDLRGQVQELAHAVDQSNTRERHLYQDLDQRLRALETGKSVPTPSSSSSPGSTPAAAGPSSQEVYDHAFSLLQQGSYTQAEKAFNDFVAKYPNDALTPNAWYWLGETRYVSRDFASAVSAFQKVVDQFSQSQKVPGALLKIGYSEYELKQWDQARQALEKVIQRFPQSTEARLARDRLKQIKSAGH